MTEVRNASSASEGKYQSYAEYIKADVECLDEIPCHWQLHALKHALEIRITDGPHETPEFLDEGVPFVSAEAVSKGFIDFSKIRGYISVADDNRFSRKYSPRKFDIYMVKSGATTGITAIVETDEHFNIWSPLAVMRCNKDFEPYYLLNYLRSRTFRESVELNWSFGTQQNIGMGTLENLPICRPPIEEQRTIAAFLDYETARIDRLIAQQQRLIELLKEKRQAVISHVVTKGLNPNASMKDSGVEWLGQVPEHWSVLRLKHVITALESGCSVNAADTPAEANEVGVLKTSCVYTRSFRANENKTVLPEDLHRVKCPVRKGSIIISRMNTPDLVGASALVDIDTRDIYLPDRLWQSIFNRNVELEPEYLAYFMTIEGFRTQISLAAEGASSSMQNIAKEDYLAINCLLPSLVEQIEIVGYLKAKLQYFDRLDASACRAIYLLQERRTALISAAVTGKIDVSDWTPPKEG